MNLDKQDLRMEYNKNTEAYMKFKNSDYIKYLENPHILNVIGYVRNKSVLDFGCGGGVHLNEIGMLKPELLAGVDLSEGQIEMCREKLSKFSNVFLKIGDVSLLNGYKIFGGYEFEVVYSNWVISHMKNLEELEIFLTNIYKLLKSGGRTYIYQGDFKVFYENDLRIAENSTVGPTSNNWIDGLQLLNTIDSMIFYDYYWTSDQIIELMNKIGFKQIERVDLYLINENFRENCEIFNKLKACYTIKAIK